ncbi:hypothetical protein [Massilia sp. TWP1-3-3]|uniref:hypothetical protein n=1 Tax=Massilia sp. TWP1-3-3 TaxID=2804573 RepID=UPI003CF04F5F
MKKSLIVLLLSLPALSASASEQSMCTANGGSFITGTVTSAPRYASGSSINGVMLSHTRLYLRADQDGKSYDVAMDNVYAVDYIKNAQAMPASLAAIRVNERLELCGATYTSGTGIHWVHSNCNATPTRTKPNGWVKHLASDGTPGINLERSQNYCYLWN